MRWRRDYAPAGRAARARRVARVRPTRRRQRHGRGDVRRARAGVGRARRRPRRARDRQHRQRARRSRPVSTSHRSRATRRRLREHSRRTRDAELRFTAWHCGVWKPVIAAVNGTCAGGGLHFVADADIVIAASRRDVPRSARLVGTGRRVRGDRAGSEVADGVRPADGARRAAASASPRPGLTSSGSSPRSWIRRAALADARTGARARPSHATPPPRWPPRSERSGVRWRPGSPTRVGAAARQLVGMWGHPDQEEGPRAFAEKREARWMTERSDG